VTVSGSCEIRSDITRVIQIINIILKQVRVYKKSKLSQFAHYQLSIIFIFDKVKLSRTLNEITMKLILIFFFMTLTLTKCGETKNENTSHRSQLTSNSFDTSVIAIIPFKTSQHWIFKNATPADLNPEDLEAIEELLIEAVEEYNPEQERKFKKQNEKHPEYKLDKKHFIIDLSRYKRQYVPVINGAGEKEVWINCFCKSWNRDWKTELIEVDDGGNCYFNLKLNLAKGKHYDFMVNGDA